MITVARVRPLLHFVLGLFALGSSSAQETSAVVVIRVGRLFTRNLDDEVLTPGMLIAEAGKIRYVGPPIVAPEGTHSIEFSSAWAA